MVTEAVVRLLPGFMGNPESLAEESHGASGLLEYPVYTKPAAWRGHDVPAVLLSGDHARIAAWRHEQARTTDGRPPPGPAAPEPRRSTVAGDADADGAHRHAGRRRRAADAAARLLGARGAGQRDARHPAAARGPRRRARLAGGRGPRSSCGPGRGWSGAVRGRLDGDDVAHRPADGRAGPAGPRARSAGCWSTIEAAAPPDARRLSLFTGARERRQPADVQEGGLPPRRASSPTDTGVVRLGKPLRRADADFSAARGAVADLLARIRCVPATRPHLGEGRRATCHRGRSARRSRRTDRDPNTTPFRG